MLCVEGFVSLQDSFSEGAFQVNGIAGIHGIDGTDHSVHVDRNRRDLLILDSGPQYQQYLLRSSQSEGGNEDFLFLPDAFSHQIHQSLFLCLSVGMQAVSVGGFRDGDVGAESGNADSVDGALGKCAEISGIKQAPLLGGQVDACGACDMSGGEKA